jgi:hypothetical protein
MIISSKKTQLFYRENYSENNSREVQSAENNSFVIPPEFRGI